MLCGYSTQRQIHSIPYVNKQVVCSHNLLMVPLFSIFPLFFHCKNVVLQIIFYENLLYSIAHIYLFNCMISVIVCITTIQKKYWRICEFCSSFCNELFSLLLQINLHTVKIILLSINIHVFLQYFLKYKQISITWLER